GARPHPENAGAPRQQQDADGADPRHQPEDPPQQAPPVRSLTMRLGIRAKEAVAVTVLTFVMVAATTIIHLSQLSRVVVQEASRQAARVARQISAQTSRALARAPGAAPLETLRGDRELRGLLEASVGYSPSLLFALVADPGERAILHSDPSQEGAPAAR